MYIYVYLYIFGISLIGCQDLAKNLISAQFYSKNGPPKVYQTLVQFLLLFPLKVEEEKLEL